MQSTADTKRAEALATEIADQLRPDGPVDVYYDRAAGTYGVRLVLGGDRYELLMPAPGALYPLLRNGAWCGGMNLRSEATPVQVALRLLGRMAETIHT